MTEPKTQSGGRRKLQKVQWIVASLALHLGPLVVVTGLPESEPDSYQDVWAGDTWIDLQTGTVPVVPEPERASLPLEQHPPKQTPKETPLPQTKSQAPPATAPERSPTPKAAAENRPIAVREPQQAKGALPPDPPKQPAPSENAAAAGDPASEEDGWLSLSDQLEPDTAESGAAPPSPSVPADPIVDRLLQAERRKKAERIRPSPVASAVTRPSPAVVQAPGSIAPANRPRDVHTAITRALPETVQREDALWRLHPLGEVGRFEMRVELVVDRLELTPVAQDTTKPRFLELRQRVFRLIGHGRFAPRTLRGKVGTRQAFEVLVRLSRAPSEQHPDEQGYSAPREEEPGVAYVYLPADRKLSFTVRRLETD